jgi:hypothetical protein
MHLKPYLLTAVKNRYLSRLGYDKVLAGIILSGWGTCNEDTGERCISHDEMRKVLLQADDQFRSQVLWQAERWSKKPREDADEQWSDLLVELLRDVWPKQKSAKTPMVSSRLCDIAFSDLERFPQMAKIILPLLTPLNGYPHLLVASVRRKVDNIIDEYPEYSLNIFHAVLPNDVREWPYDIDTTFDRIVKANGNLRLDAKLLELRRRWNAR